MKKRLSHCMLLTCCTLMLLSLVACNSPYVSKKKGYFKIELPEKKYREFNDPALPYRFEYPVYANIVQDSTYFDNNPENAYWRNIDFPQFHARIFLSYKIIGGKSLYKIKQADGTYRDSTGTNLYEKMVADAFKLTNKNDVVSTSIEEIPLRNPKNIGGILFEVGGNAATARQFFLTDTTHHFIRGALYFDATPNADSIQPALQFIEKDLQHLINTFSWKP